VLSLAAHASSGAVYHVEDDKDESDSDGRDGYSSHSTPRCKYVSRADRCSARCRLAARESRPVRLRAGRRRAARGEAAISASAEFATTQQVAQAFQMGKAWC
jgi:hypothetical protein